jgi:class 3 adenylate cyclase
VSSAAARQHRRRAVVQQPARLHRITDQSPPEQIIPLLNDYGEAVIDNGGDVLKLIGDGILAIFTRFRDNATSSCCMPDCPTAVYAVAAPSYLSRS